jgi:Na+/melibiose symporter-like transporter
MGLLGIILFFCCFLMTRERYSPRSDTSGSMLTDLKRWRETASGG